MWMRVFRALFSNVHERLRVDFMFMSVVAISKVQLVFREFLTTDLMCVPKHFNVVAHGCGESFRKRLFFVARIKIRGRSCVLLGLQNSKSIAGYITPHM